MDFSKNDTLLLLVIVILVFGVITILHRYKKKTHIDLSVKKGGKHEDGVEDIVTGAQHFGVETASEVMIPRVDIIDLTMSATFSEVMTCVVENNYSRIPVTDESHEKVKGILYVKDLLRYRNEGDDFKWQSLLRAPYFIPESKMISDLLREFQRNKVHIAIVVDEYGSISGMVTMEDILEEIVGEIQDEYDEEEVVPFEKAEDGTFTFEGKTSIADFFEAIQIDKDAYVKSLGEAETVAGFVLELMNEIPSVGQKVVCKNITFEVLEMQRQRISKIKVTLSAEQE